MNALSRRKALGAALGLAGGASGLSACRGPRKHEGRPVGRFWFSYGGNNRKVLLQLVERFNRQYQSKYWIDATYQGDYYEGLAKLRTALAAKIAPAGSHVIGEVIPYLAKAGVLEPLDKLPGASQLDIVHSLGQRGAYSGAEGQPLYCLPFNRSTPIMFMNGRLLAQAGQKAPKTWQELRQTALAITKHKHLCRWGFEVPISWWFWIALLGQAGGTLVNKQGEITLGGGAGEEAIAFLQTMMHQDKTLRPPAGRDYNAWEVSKNDFLAGRAPLIWTSTAFLRTMEAQARFPVVCAPLPKLRRHAVPTGGTSFVLLKHAPDEEKQALWAFFRFMCGDEQTTFWAKNTGYMPVTNSAISKLKHNGFYKQHPNYQVAIDQLRYAQPWPWHQELFRIQRQVVTPRLEKAILGNVSAKVVMADARRAARMP